MVLLGMFVQCNFYANYESSDEAISPVNCARASKSTWTRSPSPEMTEEPEGAMAFNTIDESTSLSLGQALKADGQSVNM